MSPGPLELSAFTTRRSVKIEYGVGRTTVAADASYLFHVQFSSDSGQSPPQKPTATTSLAFPRNSTRSSRQKIKQSASTAYNDRDDDRRLINTGANTTENQKITQNHNHKITKNMQGGFNLGSKTTRGPELRVPSVGFNGKKTTFLCLGDRIDIFAIDCH